MMAVQAADAAVTGNAAQLPVRSELMSPLSPATESSRALDASSDGRDPHGVVSSSATTEEEPCSESDEDEEADLLPADSYGIRRRKRRPGDSRIRPAYYWPSGTLARGVPCFEPTEEEFQDFNAFVEKINKYGMTAGIVKVKPPPSWSQALPPVSEQLSEVRLRDPIAQNFLGSSGLYRVANVAKSRIWNVKQWKEAADSSKYANPDFFKHKPNAEVAASARATPSEPMEVCKESLAAAAPTEPGLQEESPTKGVHDNGPSKPILDPLKAPVTPATIMAQIAAAKKRNSAMGRADISPREWAMWEGEWERMLHDAKPQDFTVEASQEIERAYWRTLTFGEPPMYGADMKGSLFTAETQSWNVADLRDLLTRLGRYHRIPGVNTPYLYFGMWRATFAWHVEDADLYSINYIHFGAPKFWYSVPQAQAEKFERVMGGWFTQEQGKCREFLRHKSFLASPKKLANEGITLNKVVQLPGEFILTFPYGYHSGFNVGFNCAESINFANDSWIAIGRKAKPCGCVEDSVKIDVDEWLRAAEIGAQSRKRTAYEPWFNRPKKPRIDYDDPVAAAKKLAAQAKKAAKAEAARKAALRLPFVCALCPDMTTETLVPLAPPVNGVRLTGEQLAHRKPGAAHKACVMYVPSTYIDVDTETGEECVYGFDGIEKDRWKLKCQLCEDRHGCPVQCTKTDKCVRAQQGVLCMLRTRRRRLDSARSITCALKDDSGVLVDAFLTDGGFEHSLIAPEEADAPLPSNALEGSVRLLVHCRVHNPKWQQLQSEKKAQKLAEDVAKLKTGSRMRIRVGGSAFDVILMGDRREIGAIDVCFEDGKRTLVKYGSIVWQGATFKASQQIYTSEHVRPPPGRKSEPSERVSAPLPPSSDAVPLVGQLSRPPASARPLDAAPLQTSVRDASPGPMPSPGSLSMIVNHPETALRRSLA